jgi:hypothetical protein
MHFRSSRSVLDEQTHTQCGTWIHPQMPCFRLWFTGNWHCSMVDDWHHFRGSAASVFRLAADPSEMLAAVCQTMRRDIPEDWGLNMHCYNSSKSHTGYSLFWAHKIYDSCQILEHSLTIVSICVASSFPFRHQICLASLKSMMMWNHMPYQDNIVLD